MKLLKLFKQLYQDYSSINREAKNSTGSYFGNLIKIFLDKTIKTIGYIWHFFFRNKKYDGKLKKFGNYKFLPDNISQNSIIYSCGIGENISFDKAVSETFDCEVFMFDSTEESKKFMSSVTDQKLKFFNIGIWNTDGDIKFYGTNDPENKNISATNLLRARIKFFFDVSQLSL